MFIKGDGYVVFVTYVFLSRYGNWWYPFLTNDKSHSGDGYDALLSSSAQVIVAVKRVV